MFVVDLDLGTRRHVKSQCAPSISDSLQDYEFDVIKHRAATAGIEKKSGLGEAPIT